jgi:hypothetical protein
LSRILELAESFSAEGKLLDGEQIYELYGEKRETKKVLFRAGLKISQITLDSFGKPIDFEEYESDGSKKIK